MRTDAPARAGENAAPEDVNERADAEARGWYYERSEGAWIKSGGEAGTFTVEPVDAYGWEWALWKEGVSSLNGTAPTKWAAMRAADAAFATLYDQG
jgi:hypothetical protein